MLLEGDIISAVLTGSRETDQVALAPLFKAATSLNSGLDPRLLQSASFY